MFFFRFPRKVSEMVLDSEEMRRKINFAVSNITGFRAAMFVPYMVFEGIVKKEIERLKQPVVN